MSPNLPQPVWGGVSGLSWTAEMAKNQDFTVLEDICCYMLDI